MKNYLKTDFKIAKKHENNHIFKNRFGRKKNSCLEVSEEKILYKIGFAGIGYVRIYSKWDLGQRKSLK